jgi:glutathione synthase/RimK-type ligase-like ATP-grasp enzyme
MSASTAVVELNSKNANSLMMIQPFMANIYKEGEISVLLFGGQVSHAVVKRVRSDDYRAQAAHGASYYTPENLSDELLTLVHAVFDACLEKPTYARIDILRDSKGVLCISELEVIEPGLFLQHASDGGEAFARAVLAAANNISG